MAEDDSQLLGTDAGIALLTGLSALALLVVAVGGAAASNAGYGLFAAAILSPIPGDAAIVGMYMMSWGAKPPLAPRPKSYMTKMAVSL